MKTDNQLEKSFDATYDEIGTEAYELTLRLLIDRIGGEISDIEGDLDPSVVEGVKRVKGALTDALRLSLKHL